MLLSEDTKKSRAILCEKSTNILISFHCRFEYVCFYLKMLTRDTLMLFQTFYNFQTNNILSFNLQQKKKEMIIKTNIILIKKYILYQCVLPNKYNSNFSPNNWYSFP